MVQVGVQFETLCAISKIKTLDECAKMPNAWGTH